MNTFCVRERVWEEMEYMYREEKPKQAFFFHTKWLGLKKIYGTILKMRLSRKFSITRRDFLQVLSTSIHSDNILID